MNENKLTAFLIDAAGLKLEQLTRDSAEDQGTGDNLIIYAADTNVVKLYSDARDRAKDKSFQVQAFQSDADSTNVALQWTLSRYIFEQLSVLPILQPEAYIDETRNLFDSIEKSLPAASQSSREQPLDAAYEKLRERYLTSTQSYDDALQEVRKMLESSDPSNLLSKLSNDSFESAIELTVGPLRPPSSKPSELELELQLMSLYRLFARDRLVRHRRFGEFLPETHDGLRVAFGQHDNLPQMVRRLSDAGLWADRLVSCGANRERSRNLLADATALAELEQLNCELVRCGYDDVVVVLITLDRSIITATDYSDKKYSGDIRAIHPKAFILDALAHQHSDHPGDKTNFHTELDDWLLNALAPYNNASLLGSGTSLAREAAQPNSTLVADLSRSIFKRTSPEDGQSDELEIVSAWQDFLRVSLWLSIYNSKDRDDIFDRLLFSSDPDEKGTDGVTDGRRERVWAETGSIWDRLLLTSVSAGRNVLDALRRRGDDSLFRSRNPPFVFFDGYPTATELVSSVAEYQDRNSIVPKHVQHNLKSLSKDTSSKVLGNTDLGYVTFLVYASICCAENWWVMANRLAERALQISRILSSQDANQAPIVTLISGREARYILGITSRLTVSVNRKRLERDADYRKSAAERLERMLLESQAHILSANQCLTDEITKVRGMSDDDFRRASKLTERNFLIARKEFWKLRFDVELNAIEISRLHTNRWLVDDIDKSEVPDCADSVYEKAVRLRKIVLETDPIVQQDDEKLRVYLLKSIGIQMLQCLHLIYGTQYGDEVKADILGDEWFESFPTYFPGHGSLSSASELHTSFMDENYLLFLDFLFSRFDKKTFVDRFDIVRTASQMERHCVLPYDDKRYNHLHSILAEYSGLC